MWRARHRLRHLEEEIVAARADQADLQRRVAMFEQIAASAGAGLAALPSKPMPQELLAAARDLHPREYPVRLDVAGTEAIAVIAGEGDPREWWTAIWQIAGPQEEAEQAS